MAKVTLPKQGKVCHEKIIFLVALAVASGAVLAQVNTRQMTDSQQPNFKPTETRAQVKAQTRAAEKAGTMPGNGEIDKTTGKPFKSSESRAQAKADTKSAIKSGGMTGVGDAGATYPGTKSAQVKAAKNP